MGDEDLRVGRLEHGHFDGVVGFQLLRQVVEVRQHRQSLDVDRRVVEGDPCDRVLDPDAEGREAVVVHCASPEVGD